MFEACICVDDGGDVAEFARAQIVQGRKEYTCCECGAAIAKGDRHEYAMGLWEGSFDTYRTCLTCVRIRTELFSCGYIFTEMWEAIHQEYCGPDYCVCPR